MAVPKLQDEQVALPVHEKPQPIKGSLPALPPRLRPVPPSTWQSGGASVWFDGGLPRQSRAHGPVALCHV